MNGATTMTPTSSSSSSAEIEEEDVWYLSRCAMGDGWMDGWMELELEGESRFRPI